MTFWKLFLAVTIGNIAFELVMTLIRAYILNRQFKQIQERLLLQQKNDDKTWH